MSFDFVAQMPSFGCLPQALFQWLSQRCSLSLEPVAGNRISWKEGGFFLIGKIREHKKQTGCLVVSGENIELNENMLYTS